MQDNYTKFAKKFLPEKIEYLLIGESPPLSPPDVELRYLYNYNDDKGNQSLLSNISFAFFEEKFFVQTNNKKAYLDKIAKEQIFLIDAVYEPINHINNRRERKNIIIENYPDLKKSIKKLPVKQNAKILLLHNNVINAISDKIRHDFKEYSVHNIGYPSCYNDPKFRRKIQNVVNPLKSETREIVVLISANAEWKIIKETLKPVLSLRFSPFGEWFPYDLDIQGRQIPIVFFHTGCGKIPAAAATQYALDKWRPPLLVNLGTCGGFNGKVEREDILLVTKTVVYDINERAGHHDEQIAKYTSKLDLSWLKKPYPLNAQLATIATADQDLDPKSIEYLYQKYGAVAADWESGAIAYVASRNNNTKCLILRGVSDVVDSSAGIPSSEKTIREGTKRVMKKLIDSLPDWIAKCNIGYSVHS